MKSSSEHSVVCRNPSQSHGALRYSDSESGLFHWTTINNRFPCYKRRSEMLWAGPESRGGTGRPFNGRAMSRNWPRATQLKEALGFVGANSCWACGQTADLQHPWRTRVWAINITCATVISWRLEIGVWWPWVYYHGPMKLSSISLLN